MVGNNKDGDRDVDVIEDYSDRQLMDDIDYRDEVDNSGAWDVIHDNIYSVQCIMMMI